ncbi:MAG: undecaprenyl-diphosphate phosphatase [Halanaerobium sp.]|nr:undecaprenyl-diphosphate phosphatase [Halanaerobium sp.]
MDLLHALFLGLIQGLTEFLPVSSSGHLVIFQNFLGITGGALTFDVFLHLGTLLSILLVFRDDILDLLTGFPGTIREITLLILAVIPAGLAGILFKDFFTGFFASSRMVGWMLLITGAVLFIAEQRTTSSSGREEANLIDSLLIGIAQSLAILPGISRSGFTLSAGLMRGLKRSYAARFSFLISIPTIGGAALIEGMDALGKPPEVNWFLVAAGTLVAFIAGVFAIKVLLKFLEQGRLKAFAIYCWILGLFNIISGIIS